MSPAFTIKESSAGQAVGVDLLSGNFYQLSHRARYFKRIGVAGSAAAGDAAVDFFIGNTKIGTFYNTTGGAVIPVEAKDLVPLNLRVLCAPAEPIRLVVADAGGTNVLAITLEYDEY